MHRSGHATKRALFGLATGIDSGCALPTISTPMLLTQINTGKPGFDSCFAAFDFGVIAGQTDATTHATNIVELGAPKKGARGQYARPEAV